MADLRDGMHPPDWEGEAPPDAARAGVIKVGASYQHVSAGERRRLEAAAIGSATVRGGRSSSTRRSARSATRSSTSSRRPAPRADRIVLAHLDRNPDLELHGEIVARGVSLVYDTIGRIKYRPDSVLLDLIEGMVAAGHGDRLVLGLDLGPRDYYRAYGGGPGLRTLMSTFVPRLRRRIGDEATDGSCSPTRRASSPSPAGRR